MKLFDRPMFLCMCVCVAASFCSFFSGAFIPLFAALATAVVFVLVFFFGAYKRLFVLLFIFLALLMSVNSFHKKVDFIDAFPNESFEVEMTVIDEPKLKNSGGYTVSSVDFGGELGNNIKLRTFYPNSFALEMGDRFTADISMKGFEETSYRQYGFSNGVMGECTVLKIKTNY